jgi:hypothetical protein
MNQWPAHSKVICMDANDNVIAESVRSRLDLSDSLMRARNSLSCKIVASTKSTDWTTWNSRNIKKIEDHIIYDLEFDGYSVKIQRLGKPSRTLCTKPFFWSLEISAAYEDIELGEDKTQTGTRFKVARSDASVKTIQATIEKVFGLPRGCVCLLTPEAKSASLGSSIKNLRNKWKNR